MWKELNYGHMREKEKQLVVSEVRVVLAAQLTSLRRPDWSRATHPRKFGVVLVIESQRKAGYGADKGGGAQSLARWAAVIRNSQLAPRRLPDEAAAADQASCLYMAAALCWHECEAGARSLPVLSGASLVLAVCRR